MKGNPEAAFPASAAETKPSLAPASPPAPPVTTATASSLEGPTASLASHPLPLGSKLPGTAGTLASF